MFRNTPGIAIFDLDGTLVDSVEDIRLAANTVRERRGERILSSTEIAPLIGHPAAMLFEDLTLDTSEMVSDFRKHLANITGTHTRVFPCVETILTTLRDLGWTLAVATNKPAGLARTVLERTNLLEFFATVQGADDLPPKPAPDVVLAALGRNTWPQAVMVGDTSMDVLAGRACGITTVAVVSGSHSRSIIEKSGPDLIVDSLCELLTALSPG